MQKNYLNRARLGILSALIMAPLAFSSSAQADNFVQLRDQSQFFCVYGDDGATKLTKFNSLSYKDQSFQTISSVARRSLSALKARINKLKVSKKAAKSKAAKDKIQALIDELGNTVLQTKDDLALIKTCQEGQQLKPGSKSASLVFKTIEYQFQGTTYNYGGAFLASESVSVKLDNGQVATYGNGSRWCVTATGTYADGGLYRGVSGNEEIEVVMRSNPCRTILGGPLSCPNFLGENTIGAGVLTFIGAPTPEYILDAVSQKVGTLSFSARPKPATGCNS